MRLIILYICTISLMAHALSCAPIPGPPINNPSGEQPAYVDPRETDENTSIGFESGDLVAMTDEMMRDMLANETLARAQIKPRVIIDAKYFKNESSARINKNMITDRLRVNLNRAANGRIIFVGQHYMNMLEKENDLDKNEAAMIKADYRLGGRVNTIDAIDQKTGVMSRFYQITFEMFNLENGAIAWSGIYDFKKSAQDDVIYR
ncbi:MAG: penicillin-binding protein activator LpoB [Candidatus Sumerlaeia bacterium]